MPLSVMSGGGASIVAFGNSTMSQLDHAAIFGNLTLISDKHGCLSLLIIICCVIILESIFELLHEITDETPFAVMVSAIEKELMIGKLKKAKYALY